MADKRIEDASQAAGEAKKSSSPEVSLWPTVREKLISAEIKKHTEPLGRLIRRRNRQTVQSEWEHRAGW